MRYRADGLVTGKPGKYGRGIMLVALLLVLHFGLAAALVYGVSQLALIPWRRARDAHWTERARLLWQARITTGLLIFTAPAPLAAAQVSLFPELPLTYLYTALAGFVGAAFGYWPMTRAIFPQIQFAGWLSNLVTGLLLRMFTLGILVAAGIFMPAELDWTAIVITAAVVAATLWAVFGGMLRLLRWIGHLTPPPDRLALIVTDVAVRMGVPLPRVWLYRAFGANAIAFPVIHTLVVTEGAMEALSDEELGAVCAHEFAHLNESRAVILARILSSFVLLPAIFLKPAHHAWDGGGWFAIGATLFISSKLITKFRHRMEKRADSVATVHEGESPGTYARALERIYEINQVPAVIAGTLSHPNLYDRLLAAGVTPAYPRPAPPKRMTWPYALVMLLLMVSVFVGMGRFETEKRKQRAQRRHDREMAAEGRRQ